MLPTSWTSRGRLSVSELASANAPRGNGWRSKGECNDRVLSECVRTWSRGLGTPGSLAAVSSETSFYTPPASWCLASFFVFSFFSSPPAPAFRGASFSGVPHFDVNLRFTPLLHTRTVVGSVRLPARTGVVFPPRPRPWCGPAPRPGPTSLVTPARVPWLRPKPAWSFRRLRFHPTARVVVRFPLTAVVSNVSVPTPARVTRAAGS